jgi:carbamoyl-phosphate synthase large subunit
MWPGSPRHPPISDMFASGRGHGHQLPPPRAASTTGRLQDSPGRREHSVGCVTAIDTAHDVLTVREQGETRPASMTLPDLRPGEE